MDAAAYQQFFLEPDDSRHRRYEALRALFVEQHSLKRVAQDYGVSYGTLSNWASEFRAQWDVGQRPPFSFSQNEAGQPHPMMPIRFRKASRSPMSANCHWKREGAFAHVMRECSCFFRCSRRFASPNLSRDPLIPSRRWYPLSRRCSAC
ncbi:MAG: helix-turn-helix domain-containing protein [Planctomycetes bacterium]|nr:helix-turn-helix domain-containing protein [Planctomycetota bacterium]